MKELTLYACERCGKIFKESDKAIGHEAGCLDLQIGQKVDFVYGITPCRGKITNIDRGGKPTVEIELEETVTENGMFPKAYLLWVDYDQIVNILT